METSPDQRWAAQVAWMNATHELFLQGQLAQGRTTEEAYALLKKVWQREDQERLEAKRQMARILSRDRGR